MIEKQAAADSTQAGRRLSIPYDICICSNVSVDFLIVNTRHLEQFRSILDFFPEEEHYELKFSINDAPAVLLKIGNEIDQLLAGRDTNPARGGFVTFKSEQIRLNLRNKTDFIINLLIGFYDIIDATINRNGSVYVFRLDYFEKAQSKYLLRFLKLSNTGVSQEGLENVLNEHYREHINVSDFDTAEVEMALSYLGGLGFIGFDNTNKVYKITAKGYMIQL